MKVHLSNYSYLRNFNVFLSGFDDSNPEKLEITTNSKWINVHPAVLVAVAALGLKVGHDNTVIDKVTARSGHYLDRMGLFKILKKESPYNIVDHESSGKFIPLTQIKTPKEQTEFISNIIPMLHLNPREADVIKYTIGELVRNVLEHSESENGAIVAAQYYPDNKIIRLGIGDTGIGVKQSMSHFWKNHSDTDLDAIKWALTPGVTGTTRREGGTSDNGGAGLFIVKSISMITRDYFTIYSGRGIYRLLKRRPDVKMISIQSNPDKDKNSQSNEVPYFPGTLIGIDISLDQIDEFVDVLEKIKVVYSKAVRERRKTNYKRPKFI